MRVVLAFVALITLGLVAACGGASPTPTPSPEPRSDPLISAEEYRATATALFQELQSMVEDGLLDPRGPDLGFSPGNPRALQWRKDVEELRDKGGTFQDGLSFEEQCFRFGDAAGDFVCGAELIAFVTVIVGDYWEEYQEWVRKFEAAAELEGK